MVFGWKLLYDQFDDDIASHFSFLKIETMWLLTASLLALFLAPTRGFNIRPRIINGDLSNPEDFPFYVLLHSNPGLCGGSLISDRYFIFFTLYDREWQNLKKKSLFNRWILTAAHCLLETTEMKVYLGGNSTGHFKYEVSVPASMQFIYPGFSSALRCGDIG